MDKEERKIKYHPGEGAFTTIELADIWRAFRPSAKPSDLKNKERLIKRFIETRKGVKQLRDLSEDIRRVNEHQFPSSVLRHRVAQLQKQASLLDHRLRSVRAAKELLNPRVALANKFILASKAASKTRSVAEAS